MIVISVLKPRGMTDEVTIVAFSNQVLKLWEQSPKPPTVRMVFRKSEENVVVITEEKEKKSEKAFHVMELLMPDF